MGIKQIKAILKLLGVKLEKKLTSDDYISGMGKKNRKISVLARVASCMEIVKKRIS